MASAASTRWPSRPPAWPIRRHSRPRPSGPPAAVRHRDGIEAFCFGHDPPIDPARFETWLQGLTSVVGSDIPRVKGILNVAGHAQPMVIHAVQHLVHPPIHLAAWPDEDRRSRLVFITRHLPSDVIEASFRTLVVEGALSLG
jgi:G3E family GTPase